MENNKTYQLSLSAAEIDKRLRTEVPTKVSQLENDKCYITADEIPEIEVPELPDIEDIRRGAAYGATSVQAVAVDGELEAVETEPYIKYVAQTLTDEQKGHARKNIGADDVYATIAQIGDINAILEGIING